MTTTSKTMRAALFGAVAVVSATIAGSAYAEKGVPEPIPGYQQPQQERVELREFTIVNTYGSALYYLYATVVTDDEWGDDLLGQYTIDTGYQITIDLADTNGDCLFDIRAEFEDGTVVEDWSIDVCANPQVTYYAI